MDVNTKGSKNISLVQIKKSEILKQLPNTLSKTYISSMNEAVEKGLSLLELEDYFESEKFLKTCVDENLNNGVAWLGLLCAKLKDKTLYTVLTTKEMSEQIDVKNHVAKMVNYIEELECATKYAADRFVSENILKYLFIVIQSIIEEKRVNLGLDKIFSLIVQYNSEIYDQLLNYMRENIENILYVCSISECESIYNSLLKNALTRDTHIKTIENIVKSYAKMGFLSNAKTWNDKLFEVDNSNFESIIHKLYFSVGAADADEFKDKQLTCLDREFFIPFLQKSISKLSKSDAECLLDFISDTELFCLKMKAMDNAELYFDFLCRYNFQKKLLFLDEHQFYIKELATSRRTLFFEKYMTAMSDKSAYWHIRKRLEYAEMLRNLNFFEEAEKGYRSILLIEKENTDAWNGIFSCKLNFDGKKGDKIKWKKFSIAQLKKILSTCRNETEKKKILQYYTQACILSVSLRSKDQEKCCKVFDYLMKCLSWSKSEPLYNFANEFLRQGHFSIALKYANLSLGNDTVYNIKSRYIILLATLRCKDEQDFKKCEKFSKSMIEYKLLLSACETDSDSFAYYIDLVQENETCVAKIKQARKEINAKSKQCLKRGFSGLIIPVLNILLLGFMFTNYEWQFYLDLWYDNVESKWIGDGFVLPSIFQGVFWIFSLCIILVGIYFSWRLICCGVGLKITHKIKNELKVDQAVRKIKWLNILGIICFGIEIFELFIPGFFSILICILCRILLFVFRVLWHILLFVFHILYYVLRFIFDVCVLVGVVYIVVAILKKL